MAPQLQWRPSAAASLLHMVTMWQRCDEIVDPQLVQVIGETFDSSVWNSEKLADLWRTFLSNPADFHLPEELSALAERVEQLYPNLASELDSRIRPLRDAWESRGPGIFHRLAQAGLPVERLGGVTVLVVHPVLGGYGRSFFNHNTVLLEGMLVNRLPHLPEVLRVAWLLTTFISQDTLAPLPPLLDAAEFVELARNDVATIALALRNWPTPPFSEDESSQLAQELWDCWHNEASGEC